MENSANSSTRKRSLRGRYLDARDKSLLSSLTKKYECIILDRKIDHATNHTKNLIWQTIADEFNENTHSTKKRTAEQLKNIYRNNRAAMKRVLSTLAAFKEQRNLAESYSIQHFDTSYSCDNIELLSSPEQSVECSLEEEPQATNSESISDTSLLEPMTYNHQALISAQFADSDSIQFLADSMHRGRATVQGLNHKEQRSATQIQKGNVSQTWQFGNFSSHRDNGNGLPLQKDNMCQTSEPNRPEIASTEPKDSLTSKEMRNILFNEQLAIGKLKRKLLESKIKYFEEKTRLLSKQNCNKKR